MIGTVRDWFARNVLGSLFRQPENLLWVDRHGVLRDLYWRPIKAASVGKERVREAWARRAVDGHEYKVGGTD